ncbi:MAG: hypothetical protein UY23_C0001G0181 [Candidatus Jorgensenbacteria bacterium GW2011_GWA1_48_11]|uniref:Uncharacterized protein n=1 Tax=Candidatus Jorgensenbacteria bacterium GW2011_GWA1_48_11 TaxID=1618660 RepID=A0A0G1XB71_9BACT|nr:MAG: hypothetical protein UY23_C0001G0181 [Candidatus Jorgensenbacteria bacterium GW2011_GWA1_48_11]KKW12068.1 MAG: hypothetical protein UY51_C0005G0310 [Candidatus Jorgensenbacteria bacterium GW2011_GWB1_49_9]
MNELKKVTESEMVIGGVFTLGLDGLCALIDATGVGLAIAPIIQSFATFSITMWLKTKGGTRVKIGKEAVKYAANFLPVLPTVTAIFAVSAYVHNHPEKFGGAETLTGPAGKPAMVNLKINGKTTIR